MPVNINSYQEVFADLAKHKVLLIAVSKTKPHQDVLDLYQLGQMDFGENYVQELVDKAAALPQNIHWHFIGHLQSNKVKYIAPFVYLIHSVDSEKLLIEINKQAQKNNRIIEVLLQVHIASEETKFGFDDLSLLEFIQSDRLKEFTNIRLRGLMGMASYSNDSMLVQNEFLHLKNTYNKASAILNLTHFNQLSMGMSSDYILAMQQGSTMVRIGSLLFGDRVYNN